MLDELKSRIPEFNIFRNLNLAGKIFFIAVPIPGIRNLHSVIASVFPDFGADGRIQQRSAVRAARQSKRVAGSAVQVGRSRVDG